MADTLSQDKRLIAVDTPLGKDVLLLDSFTGSEAVSQLFHFDVNMIADRANGSDAKVDPKKLLGQWMTLSITTADGKKRYINGIVRRLRKGAVTERFAAFKAELVPSLWLMSLQAGCRIFQDMTLPAIIEQVLKDGNVKFKMNLIGKYNPVDYCVLYRETSLNFVCRLMEEAGISYWFDHTDKEHTMMLADAPSGHKDCVLESKFNLESQAGSTDDDFINSWEERQELNIGQWSIKDVHLELLGSVEAASATSVGDPKPPGGFETYDYPGGYAKRFNKPGERLSQVQDEGDALVAVRMDESDANLVVIDASSNCRALVPGFKISVDTRTLQKISGSYILTSVRHAARQSPSYTGADAGGGNYENDFNCVPATTKLRPPRETPKPIVQGLQYAKVVDEGKPSDPPKEEITPDKFGRVRLVFPWDNLGDSACWVPVAQMRAGQSGGQIWIPRVGDYVVVSFLEGDPDCPVVVGSIYNGKFPPPYALPANKTQSGIKTRSTPKGGADDYNELRFEDKKDAEEILLHAQKVLKVEVEADEFRTVGNERTTVIQKDDTRTNKEGDETVTVEKGSQYTTIDEGDHELTIKKGHSLHTVEEGPHQIGVLKGNALLDVQQGHFTTKVNSDVKLQIKQGNWENTVDMGNVTTKVSMGNVSEKIDMGNLDLKLGMGNVTMKCDLGKVSIESLQGIELKCGTSSIKIDMMGVTIKGMMIQAEGQVQTQIKGLMTMVKGDAMLQASGAITMIG
jgi:type VI secretion system secreted protein VgrG